MSASSPETVLRVVKGCPSEEEVAALLVVLMALRSARESGRGRRADRWGAPERALWQLSPSNRVAHPWRRG